MLQYTEGDLTVKGIKLHYYRTGGGRPPFILLHGATDNGLCWMPIAEILAAQYDVIMPDAQGHGLSDRLDKNFSFQSHADQVVGLTEQLSLKKPIIMGHSMGAGTAVNVAVSYPDLPRAIVLEDPPWGPSGPPPPPPGNAELEPAEDFVQRLIRLNKLSLEEIIENGKEIDPSWTDEERLYWAKAKQQFDPSLFSYPVINERPYTEFIPRINCPTLLIIAESGLVSKATAEDAAKLWKSKQPFKWVRIMGAMHNIRRDNFPAYRDALLNFLKDLPS